MFFSIISYSKYCMKLIPLDTILQQHQPDNKIENPFFFAQGFFVVVCNVLRAGHNINPYNIYDSAGAFELL